MTGPWAWILEIRIWANPDPKRVVGLLMGRKFYPQNEIFRTKSLGVDSVLTKLRLG